MASLGDIPWQGKGGGGDHVIMILGVTSLDLWHRLLRDRAGLHGCHVLGIT